ncbi:MAG: TolB family protein [Thermomicrobiales bacterium]
MAYIDRNTGALMVVKVMTGEEMLSAPVTTIDALQQPLALLTFGGPAWAPDGSRLAFNCWDGRGDEVCVIRSDGTDRRQITRVEASQSSAEVQHDALIPAPANIGPPAWAPNGESLAVASYPERGGAPKGVFVVHLETGTAERVSTLVPNSEISWLPDGDSLLFSAIEDGRSDVRLVSIGDDDASNLTSRLPQPAREPALSRDGSRLAVSSGGAIVVVSLDGEVEATQSLPLYGWSPAWSPGGDTLAFVADPDPIASLP